MSGSGWIGSIIAAPVRLLLIAVLALSGTAVHAWPLAIGSNGDDEVVVTRTSSSGDVYVAGHFSGSIILGGETLITQGLQDIFVARIGPGGLVEWARSAGGELTDTVRDMVLDDSNNLFLVGEFFDTAFFGGSQIEAASDTASDGFVARLNTQGDWQWARRMGGDGEDRATGVVALPGDTGVVPPTPESVAVAGSYQCQASFDGGSNDPVDLDNGNCFDGASDLFIARYTATGNLIWAVDRGDQASGIERADRMVVDDNNRVYLTGSRAEGGTQTLVDEDFESSLADWGVSSPLFGRLIDTDAAVTIDFGFTFPVSYSFFNGSRVLALLGDSVNVALSSPVDTANADSIVVSADLLRGFDPNNNLDGVISEKPDSGEEMTIEYRDSGGQWQTIVTLGGDAPADPVSPVISLNKGDHPGAFHDDFSIRFRLNSANGSFSKAFTYTLSTGFSSFLGYYDWFYADNLKVDTVGQQVPYVLSVTNLLSESGPTFSSSADLPAAFDVRDIALDAAGDRLLLHGRRSGAVTFAPCAPVSGAGAYLLSLDITTSTIGCAWQQAVDGGTGEGVTVDASGNVYITGRFRGSTTFNNDPDGTLQAVDGQDVYIASLTRTGTWRWVTGGAVSDPSGIPDLAGGPGNDAGLAVTTRSGIVYVGGRFEQDASFGPVDLQALAGTDAFVINLGTDGQYFREEVWTAGVPLTPPDNAKVDAIAFQPEFRVAGQPFDAIGQEVFLWTPPVENQDAQLIPLQPFGGIEVLWRVQGSELQDPDRIISLGRIAWPTEACTDTNSSGCYQVHVAGAPVDAEPPTGGFRALRVLDPSSGSSGPSLESGRYSTTQSGTGVLIYVSGPSLDTTQYPQVVEIVRSLPYNAVPDFVDGVEAEIGRKITDPFHNQPNRTGWVINEFSPYDGLGQDAAYNRSSRSGAIIPVNRNSPRARSRELAVAWYRENSKGVYWPSRAVRYEPRWPFDPERIIIASQQGGEVLGQAPLDPLIYNSARVYVQNDIDAPGYNPNDEHAFMAPSATGSGVEAVFALRADFGDGLPDVEDAASDPYVLVKYFDTGNQEWAFRIYRVEATGAGFSRFRFDGTAGTTVEPPYPVRLLPACTESFVTGQAQGEQPPPPFFQDYSGQLWSKSAGSGSVHYYYPAQPGFFVDLDTDDVNDIEASDCVPWLARLPADQGGTASLLDPIEVFYDITWPARVPLLTIGETLLSPKRGLPDIINQAAVEVVYDAIQETRTDPLPSDTLAQLIDPLNPRYVYLDAIPAEVATQFQTDGTEAILGSADGTIKLPVSIRDRIRHEPLEGRLALTGVFDESGAGEPFLLLNVLSKRDRVTLKTLNGGDGSEDSDYDWNAPACLAPDSACSWDEAIEALFRLSRNPQRIERICTDSELDPNRQRICNQSRAVTADDVLIGYQDETPTGGDGILEPFQAVGVQAALTAGKAQGSGYLTVAFNNDASLSPLPVSLEIMQVGCLRSPPPPDDPDILSTYQGQINVIAPDNIFDEQLVLRHSGDFGGDPDALEFQWFFQPDSDGTPPMPVPDPENGQLNGWIQFPVDDPQGAVEISIEGANIQTLSDNWYLARYRGLPACGNDTEWSLWAGSPGATPLNQLAQLAEGWVKRVLGRLNPFEARVQDFARAATNNYASMLIQLGERYEGPVALNNDPDNLNSLGLIEAYTTVMRRALQLSVDGTPPINYGPVNNAILLVASRLVDFYTLLGNEAYADAQDPTIGITTNNGQFSLAPSIFNFQNQLASLLEEELVLLRGRDDSLGPVAASPVYNRLFWNFTTGDGEVAYAQSYDISDQNADGVIDEFDARIMFPQGHGDAWGHYLTGTKTYYELLRHPFYTWDPRAEAILVAGVPISVDFLDERQFAETAAAKARVGAEIVDLTYRNRYVEDPAGQWQGYEDTDPERAWGLSEWGRRAGMGAYYDWVVANSILPAEDPDPGNVSIQRVDRTTVGELDEITGHYDAIQGQVDKADAGLNPLGLATGVVPFDIDPSLLDRFNQTQFEQVSDRAMGALNNARQVWDFANQLTNQMRRNQNEVDDLRRDSNAQENDFSNQLIEIFGYPYSDDIGPGGVYPAGYDGPDLYHYMYIDVPQLAGTAFDFDDPIDLEGSPGINRIEEFTGVYSPAPNGLNFYDLAPSPQGEESTNTDNEPCSDNVFSSGCALGNLDIDENDALEVTYTTIESPDVGFWFTKPETWVGQRRAPGELQQILQQMLQARIALRQALVEYDRLRQEIEAQIDAVQATFNIAERNFNVLRRQRDVLVSLTAATQIMRNSAIVARRIGEFISASFKSAKECVPDNLIAGLSGGGDLFSTIKCGVSTTDSVGKFVADSVADGLDIAANATESAKEDVSQLAGLDTFINDANLDLYNVKGEIDALLRREPILRAEVFARTEAIKQLVGDYQATLARGLRTLERLKSFRRKGAEAVQEYRYQDMAFRIFRNDALQKYRAAFDLAARYVYLAASAYDYETNLLGGDSQAGQEFLTDIVRQRSIGEIINGEPIPGTPGLADSMAQLRLNFDVLKGQMGFNNPQVETNRFSLRRELFRIPDGPEGDRDWRRRLEEARVANLWSVPEFRRYARPFAPESAGPQPGLVLEFTTNVTFGLNFFGWDLGPGDSSYDSSQFATRVRSVGTWFGNYAQLPLADDPRIYLFPVGADVLRAPDANDFSTREWQVVDQAIPIPFPIASQDLDRFDWQPIADTLSGSPVDIRRFARFRAYHFSEPFDDAQVIADSRLVGRSVWNRRWKIIIPGGTFLNDPVEGLDTFIHGQRIPGGGGERDGQGVDDILIFFKTYAYSGR